MNLTGQEIATVLAALRYWQAELDDFTGESQIARAKQMNKGDDNHFFSVEPLNSDEIDSLCEKINCGGA